VSYTRHACSQPLLCLLLLLLLEEQQGGSSRPPAAVTSEHASVLQDRQPFLLLFIDGSRRTAGWGVKLGVYVGCCVVHIRPYSNYDRKSMDNCIVCSSDGNLRWLTLVQLRAATQQVSNCRGGDLGRCRKARAGAVTVTLDTHRRLRSHK
jgi:hypothetical protein